MSTDLKRFINITVQVNDARLRGESQYSRHRFLDNRLYCNQLQIAHSLMIIFRPLVSTLKALHRL